MVSKMDDDQDGGDGHGDDQVLGSGLEKKKEKNKMGSRERYI